MDRLRLRGGRVAYGIVPERWRPDGRLDMRVGSGPRRALVAKSTPASKHSVWCLAVASIRPSRRPVSMRRLSAVSYALAPETVGGAPPKSPHR